MSRIKVFTTTGSEPIAQAIGHSLTDRLPSSYHPGGNGVELAKKIVSRFSNDNIEVQLDENVRGHFVVIIHSQVPPVNENMMELFALLDAIMNAGAEDMLLVFPYMPYSRSDRKNKPRISVLGVVVPDFVNRQGVKRVLLLDPHSENIKHYFRPAADEVTSLYLLANYIEKKFFLAHARNTCHIVFADAGSGRRYGRLPKLVKLSSTTLGKDRPDDNEQPDFKEIEKDSKIRDKHCIMIDDEILTGNTSIGAAQELLKSGAASVSFMVTHAPLQDQKISIVELVDKLEASPFERIVLTDSIPVRHKLLNTKKFEVITVAPLLAEAISRIVQIDSVSILHDYDRVAHYIA